MTSSRRWRSASTASGPRRTPRSTASPSASPRAATSPSAARRPVAAAASTRSPTPAAPPSPPGAPELRDAGVLKLFFGADPPTVAAHQIAVHETQLAEYRALRAQILDFVPPGQLLALDVGIAHEQAMIDIWGKTARAES